ncbi:MAG: glycine--tRNA ligase [Candidatus Colwellbacteria bacterium CG_4_9_14_0_2_um_filter_50_12]|uniref:glycine--tRNA ligase n=1 Tax=Candidatus Colwellbacteria bacterium CG_4_9_14_0_2_um_filter_50_12 TaxID=1974538 RepID=A0A2M8G1I5_9BACT|nr:MAG: glycine--tRNA ligase [Candidatus Colwellbacteria bacterium CG_4_9_14_0_2_um_filter_50_12]
MEIKDNNLMEKIVSLAKRRGFVFPGSEIYGGLGSTYDYGPLGVELKNNIKREWWNYFIHQRNDMVGLDGGILLSPKVWEASGHVKNFKDALVECKKCHHRFRPDKLRRPEEVGAPTNASRLRRPEEVGAPTNASRLKDPSKCPDCGGEFTEAKLFSGMFKTVIGPIEKEGVTTYLRPETAQAIFADYKNILSSGSRKIPFGVGQIGKAFRNEVTTGNFIFRTLEFEQMEIEYFISPDDDWQKIFKGWVDYIHGFMDVVGLERKRLFDHEIPDAERAFYSKRTIDMEYEFPFGQDELWAVAYRTDYDLSKHQEYSGVNMEYLDDRTGKKYIPHVIEPTFGVDRTILAILSTAYSEEGDRTVLKLKPNIAPYKAAVFPLLANKPDLVNLAKKIYGDLKKSFYVAWDDRGNIGKRYYSQDEIGTPYCITVDFDSLESDDVTVRDRDTMKQKRVAIKELAPYLEEYCSRS